MKEKIGKDKEGNEIKFFYNPQTRYYVVNTIKNGVIEPRTTFKYKFSASDEFERRCGRRKDFIK